jgi:hypothetical protein
VRANSERSVAFSKEVIEVRRAEVFPFHRLTSDIGSEKESGDCKVDEGTGCTSNKRKRRLREETEKTKNDVGKTEREKQLRRPTASNTLKRAHTSSFLLLIAFLVRMASFGPSESILSPTKVGKRGRPLLVSSKKR